MAAPTNPWIVRKKTSEENPYASPVSIDMPIKPAKLHT